jgi:hypothetical protein
MNKYLIFYFIISVLFLWNCNYFPQNSYNAVIKGDWCFMDENKTYWEIKITDTSIFINDGIFQDLSVFENDNFNFQTINILGKEYIIENLKCDTLIIKDDKRIYFLYKFENKAQDNISVLAFYFRKYNFLVHQGVMSVDSAWYNIGIICKNFYGVD